jgi:cytidylate kinase
MAILTISRELGASGTYIALKIAEKLGYTCYDQQILNTIAEKMGKEKDQLQHFDQNTYNRIGVFFQEAIASLAQGGMVFHPFGLGALNWDATEMFSTYPQQSFKEKDYYEVLRQVFKELADKNNAIFLGRGGCHILKEYKNTLHVRIIADYEDRLNHVIKEQTEGGRFYDSNYKTGEDAEQDQQRAEKLIHDWDTASANFIADFFDSDWNDPHNYDIILNTSKITPDNCVTIIENLIKNY